MSNRGLPIVIVIVFSIVLAACGSTNPEPTPIEGEVVEGLAYVEAMDILILESFPVQVNVRLNLQVSDACTQIGKITTMRDGTTFLVTVPTRRPAEAICAEEVTHFEEFVTLDVLGLSAGEYTVDANGHTGTFTLDMDNHPQLPSESDEGTEGDTVERGLAGIQSATIEVEGEQVTILISGWLADGCTELGTISESVSDQSVQITVETLRDPNLMCVQVVSKFETSYTLASSLPAGEYTLEINDSFSTTFTVE